MRDFHEKQVDWLDEECDALARKGLRTLVFAAKDLTEQVCAMPRERERECDRAFFDPCWDR